MFPQEYGDRRQLSFRTLVDHSRPLPQLRGLKINSMWSDSAFPGCWVPKDKFHKQLPKGLLYVTLIQGPWHPALHKIDLVHLRTKESHKLHFCAFLQAGMQLSGLR